MAPRHDLFPPPRGLLQALPAWSWRDKSVLVPRKQKSEPGKGQEVPKPPRGKAVKQEPEETPCMVQVPASPLHA